MKSAATTSKNLFRSFKEKSVEKIGRVWGEICPWPAQNQRMDVILLVLVIAMVLFGLLMVYSSSFIYAHDRSGDGFSFIRKQLLFAGLGFIVLWVAALVDYRKWRQWGYPLMLFSTVALGLVLIPELGVKVGGAQRWIRLGGTTLQPGELAKFALVLFIAAQLARKQEILHRFVPGVLSVFLLSAPSLVLLLVQPDFGTVAMVSVVAISLMFLAGVPIRYLLSSVICLGGAGAWLVMKEPYRLARLTSFMNPWEDPSGKGFQILQSLLGLHNGKFFGVGLGNGKQKLFFLPEAHNDFIVAVIGEEMGFLGILLLTVAFGFLVYRGLKIGVRAYQNFGDRFALYLATGITLILGIQGFVNMAVVMGLLPTKGLTLPFISYGGSALMMNLFAVGVLLSISRGPTRSLQAQPRELT